MCYNTINIINIIILLRGLAHHFWFIFIFIFYRRVKDKNKVPIFNGKFNVHTKFEYIKL